MPWTSPTVELDVKPNEKKCSRCQKFKSAQEFYKQGDRHESCCKECKREGRISRKYESPPLATDPANSPTNQAEAEKPKQKPKSYEDLGFTKQEFLEIVDFFQELMRLDRKGMPK